jgi:CubicO group peptidase (beta-lactamase class C family)
LNELAVRHQVPGLAAVVLRGDRILAKGAGGGRKAGAPERLTVEDRFLLSSGTKAMTATLAALIIQEGKLTWTTTLGEIFPDTFKRMDPGWQAVTLAQLLEHRAGVPNDRAYLWTLLRVQWFSRGSPSAQREAVIAKVMARAPSSAPGAQFVYTSLDYFIVAAALEKVTGRTFEALMQERLWRPLGITSGGFGSPGSPRAIDQPWGHWGSFLTGRPIAPTGFWGRLTAPRFYASAGTVHMTVTDWAKFIALHLRGDPANPFRHETLLTREVCATLHQAEAVRSEGNLTSLLPERWPSAAPVRRVSSGYEGGWFLERHAWAKGVRAGDTGRVLRSLGDNGFWHADAQVAPEIDFAVLVICNQGGVGQKPAARACEEAAVALRREFLPSK